MFFVSAENGAGVNKMTNITYGGFVTKNVNVILHTCALPPLSPYVLHYGPMDASKNGEPVFNYRYGLPGEDWRGAEPNDPLSVVDQVGTKYFIGKNSAEVGEFDKKGLVQYCINWHLYHVSI